MHDLPLLTTVAAAFTAAWLLGLLTQWMRLSPIVGYLLAGVIIGPHTPGFVGDVHLAQQLAEVGVILLMFGVGLHFHLKDLHAVRGIAVPGALGQSLCATLAAMAAFAALGLSWLTGAVLGMAMAVASTVVLMRVLMDAEALDTPAGHVAVGWLIVEDLLTVVVLVLIPVLGSGAGGEPEMEAAAGPLWQTLGLALLKLGLLVAIVLLAGSRVVPRVLVLVARLRSRELFTLTVLVISIATAVAAYTFFGVSMALGAFLAGMVVSQSPVSHQAAADALPLRDAFSVLFFVSVGMLFDPAFLIQEPVLVLTALGVILVAKPLAAWVIVALLGHSVRTALTVAFGLAQIGEFSFILSDAARRNGLLPDAGHNVLVAAAIISIMLNPLLFRAIPRMEAWMRRRPRLWRLLNRRAELRVVAGSAPSGLASGSGTGEAKRLAVVVGYGPVGRSVHRVLKEAGLDTVVVDLNMDAIAELHAAGQAAIYGDASHPGILEKAGVGRATHLVITVPNAAQRAAMVTAGRALNERVRIVVRARYLQEREELERGGATAAVFEEAESAVALARLVLADTGFHRVAAERKLRDIRLQLITDNLSGLRAKRVASVMVPWTRVRFVSAGDGRQAVLSQIARERHSRWPVVDSGTRRPVGYLLARDLIAHSGEQPWTTLVRPLRRVQPDDSIEAALNRMQDEGDSLCLVEDGGAILGLITMEDILEQVVGRLTDEDSRDEPLSLADALSRGGMVPALQASTHDQVIQELVSAVPRELLPPGVERAHLAAWVLAREQEITTDLGNGIAIPHARCPGLAAPVVVMGRSGEGVVYSPGESLRVRLFFLLITPEERPEVQLALLRQLARIAASGPGRDELLRAASPADIVLLLDRFARKGSPPPEETAAPGRSGKRPPP